MSFEDFLDLLSVFSDSATAEIKSHYAFRIFGRDQPGPGVTALLCRPGCAEGGLGWLPLPGVALMEGVTSGTCCPWMTLPSCSLRCLEQVVVLASPTPAPMGRLRGPQGKPEAQPRTLLWEHSCLGISCVARPLP